MANAPLPVGTQNEEVIEPQIGSGKETLLEMAAEKRGPSYTGHMTTSLEMGKDQSHMTETILNLTIEIICLLTGENVTPVKSDGRVTITVPPPYALKSEKHNKQKILEVTRKMMELLTGEVPIRYQDVTVYFSMEEWQYLDGHKDLYKDAMMESQLPLISPDGSSNRNPPERCTDVSSNRNPPERHTDVSSNRNPPERHTDVSSNRNPPERCTGPLYSQDCPPEDPTLSQHDQDEEFRVVVKEEEEELYVSEDWPSVEMVAVKEDDSFTEISLGGPCMRRPVHRNGRPAVRSPGIRNPSKARLPSLPDYAQRDLADNSSDQFCHRTIDHPGVRSIVRSHHHPPPQGSHSGGSHAGPQWDNIFPCSVCGKCFAKYTHLRSHLRMHTDETPFICPECGTGFEDEAMLLVHLQYHNSERPYPCSVCGKGFRQKSYLAVHQRSHTGEKPYCCPDCGTCFRQKSHLMLHKRCHTGEKPYSCPDCGKCFSRRSSVHSHLRSHMRKMF